VGHVGHTFVIRDKKSKQNRHSGDEGCFQQGRWTGTAATAALLPATFAVLTTAGLELGPVLINSRQECAVQKPLM
jgi:hypothetical protein